MPGHVGQQDRYTAPQYELASGVARSWSAIQKILTDRRRPLERRVIEQSASAVVSAVMIGILVGAALRATTEREVGIGLADRHDHYRS
ncbi:hypothetical protein SAMN03159423_5470 [Bradyrhizobium sp. NFR13]|nr:hypothetical protein SAMN03159423_5470 [Bradyrhizobium sp. NFR13]